VQIRPLVRHNLYYEFKKPAMERGVQLHVIWISELFLYFFVVYLNDFVSGSSNKTTNGGING
jgi:hypothetical protein